MEPNLPNEYSSDHPTNVLEFEQLPSPDDLGYTPSRTWVDRLTRSAGFGVWFIAGVIVVWVVALLWAAFL